MQAPALIIALVAAGIAIFVVTSYYAPGMELLTRVDGEFVPFSPPSPHTLASFYVKHNLKPIQLLFRTTSQYTITVRIGTNTHTLTIPTNYVTDGVSKPLRKLPIPHEHEDAYWVYHDYMYQFQRFDDGTPITKRQADNIMHMIIVHNKLAPQWCKLYRLFVNYNNYNQRYWDALHHRGPCFYVSKGTCAFPSCNAILQYCTTS